MIRLRVITLVCFRCVLVSPGVAVLGVGWLLHWTSKLTGRAASRCEQAYEWWLLNVMVSGC